MKVLELVLLFVACFSAVFNVLCYFLNLSLLPNIFYHFILAVVCIIIVIVVLFIYLKSDAPINSEVEFEEDDTNKQKLKEDDNDDNQQINPVNSFENDLAEVRSIEKDVGEFEKMFENYRNGNYANIIKDLQKKLNKSLQVKTNKNGKKRN